MPTLLFPLGLATLTALLIPLAIHLARRTEQRPLDFAALRWLRQRPRPRHRPRFDEWVLLAMRLFLLALLSLLFARPVVLEGSDRTPVIAVAPGVDPQVSGKGEGRRLWLAPGFPSIDQRPTPHVPTGSLIRQLDADLPPGVPLTVVVPAVIDGADAQRPLLSRPVTWRVVAGAMAPRRAERRRVRVAVQAAGDRYIRAAAGALGWTVTGRQPARDTTALIRLAPGAMPPAVSAWIEAGGTALVGRGMIVPEGAFSPAWLGPNGETLVEERALGAGRLLRFTRVLTPAAMPALVDPGFPDRLASLLLPPAPAPGRVMAEAYRPQLGGPAPTPGTQDLRPWLVLAIAAWWLIERWLATSRRRALTP